MARGRKTGGRRKGSLNRKKCELAARADDQGITPLDVMLQTMRAAWDAGDRATACACAKDAAPYVRRKLISSENKTETTVHFVAEIPTLAPDDETWQAQHSPPTTFQ